MSFRSTGVPPLSRRPATFLTSSLLLVALVSGAALLPMPYVVQAPGLTEDTLATYEGTPLLEIEDRRTYPTQGRLLLTTVGYIGARRKLDLWSAMRAWLDPRKEVVPRALVYPEDQTPDQVEEQNAEEMSRSQEAAKVAALREVGIRVPQRVVVEAVQKEAPALGRLKAGDVVLSVDGVRVDRPDAVRRLITAHEPGEEVVFVVRREGREVTVRVPTTEAADESGRKRTIVGIVPAVGYDLPLEIDITLADRIGGPSAGLVFALGIVDKLTPGALTGGATVAGTGEISPDGEVGRIGGIRQKVYGAEDAGATVFLAPAGNCEELEGFETDLRIVRVETLSGAVDALEALAAGEEEAVPEC